MIKSKKVSVKAVWDKQGLSYRWQTFWLLENLETNLSMYYRLYRQNTDIRRCIEELYQTAGQDWYILTNKAWNIRWDVLVENVLNFENRFGEFKSTIVRDLSVAWNVFIIPIKNASWKIIWFQILDPRTIRIVANKYWEVLRYIQVKWSDSIIFQPNEIFHFKDSIDPDNEVFWISKVETLVYDVMGDSESSKSNYAYFKNNWVPSTIITLDNELSEQELNIALEQLKKQFSWWANKHRVSASTWIKDIKVIWSTIKDMEFVQLRWFTTERICCAFWVPKTILWYSDNVNFSTSDNMYRKYIENTIRPLQNQLEIIFNSLIYLVNPTITFKLLDNNEIWIKETTDRNLLLLANWIMTINEIRKQLWMDLIKSEIANTPIIKQWFVLLDDVWVDNINQMANIPK